MIRCYLQGPQPPVINTNPFQALSFLRGQNTDLLGFIHHQELQASSAPVPETW